MEATKNCTKHWDDGEDKKKLSAGGWAIKCWYMRCWRKNFVNANDISNPLDNNFADFKDGEEDEDEKIEGKEQNPKEPACPDEIIVVGDRHMVDIPIG